MVKEAREGGPRGAPKPGRADITGKRITWRAGSLRAVAARPNGSGSAIKFVRSAQFDSFRGKQLLGPLG